MEVQKGTATCHGDVGMGLSREWKSPKPRKPGERGDPPHTMRVGSAEPLCGVKLQQDRLSEMMGAGW